MINIVLRWLANSIMIILAFIISMIISMILNNQIRFLLYNSNCISRNTWSQLLQSIADCIKLLTKHSSGEINHKINSLVALRIMINLGISVLIITSLSTNSIIDSSYGIWNILLGYVLGECLLILSGVLLNNVSTIRYSVATAYKFFAYILILGIGLLGVLITSSSLNLRDILSQQQAGVSAWLCWPLLPIFGIYLSIIIVNYNHDCIVSHNSQDKWLATYMSSCGGRDLLMLYLVKYSSMILLLLLASIIFLGGGSSPFKNMMWIDSSVWIVLKILVLQVIISCMQCILPKYYLQQILNLCWVKLFTLGVWWLVFLGIWYK